VEGHAHADAIRREGAGKQRGDGEGSKGARKRLGNDAGRKRTEREVIFRAAVKPSMAAAGKTSCFARPVKYLRAPSPGTTRAAFTNLGPCARVGW
jgi:hypothetical protein